MGECDACYFIAANKTGGTSLALNRRFIIGAEGLPAAQRLISLSVAFFKRYGLNSLGPLVHRH